jgi:hypothetical protein
MRGLAITGTFHPLASLVVIVSKVVGQHLLLNVIPKDKITANTESDGKFGVVGPRRP